MVISIGRQIKQSNLKKKHVVVGKITGYYVIFYIILPHLGVGWLNELNLN
jgi:hypothetical protein